MLSSPSLTRRNMLLGTAALTTTLATTKSATAQPQEATCALCEGESISEGDYEIVEIRDGIWRTRDTRHTGLLVDTDEGMIVFDTLNADFAGWLNGQIKTRFNKPVDWVVYSHNHSDHVSGGQAFVEHAPRYISHSLARNSMERMSVQTHLPTETFEERFDIRHGGRDIELRYHGKNDGHGSISFFVPDQRVISAIDWLLIGRVPFRDLARYDVEGTIRSLHDIDTLDWELAAPGHADIGDKAGARVVLRYYETIRDGVTNALASGTSLDQLTPLLRTELAQDSEFAQLASFDDWVELNIKGIFEQIARSEGYMDG